MKNLLKILSVSAVLIGASSPSVALVIGLNPSTPLGGYDLGGGQFASLLGIQSPNSLVGQTIALSNLETAIQSGTVNGFYFAAGNSASANFGSSVTPFAPFVSAVVAPGTGNPTNVLDSLYAIHSGTVVFSNGGVGTNTLETTGARTKGNPFTETVESSFTTTSFLQSALVAPPAVPDSGATIGLLGAVLVGLSLLRRRLIG